MHEHEKTPPDIPSAYTDEIGGVLPSSVRSCLVVTSRLLARFPRLFQHFERLPALSAPFQELGESGVGVAELRQRVGLFQSLDRLLKGMFGVRNVFLASST